MSKEFDEKLFLNIENIIVECLFYANKEIDKIMDIYIYISYEGFDFFNVFFRLIDNKIYKKHKISEIIQSIDSSSAAQSVLNKKVNLEISKIKKLFESDNRELPTQIRIQYKPELGSNKVKFLYQKFHNDDLLIGDHEIFDKWYGDVEEGVDDLR